GDQEQLTDLIKFAEYAAEEPSEPKYPLTGEEAEQHSLLDLLLLAIRRVCELAHDDGLVEWPFNPVANEFWKQFLSSSSVRRRYWKGELHDFIVSLTETDYEFIRRRVTVGRIPLHEMGFWNLLSDVLSHFAVLRIRDWGSYYHLIGENPNAAEHLVMWLRAIKSSESLRGIRGGMAMIVEQLRARLETYDGVLTLEKDRLLQKLEPGTGEHEGYVVLHFDGR